MSQVSELNENKMNMNNTLSFIPASDNNYWLIVH